MKSKPDEAEGSFWTDRVVSGASLIVRDAGPADLVQMAIRGNILAA